MSDKKIRIVHGTPEYTDMELETMEDDTVYSVKILRPERPTK
jgi:hypothetical protein